MALRIYETDPEAAPKPRANDDYPNDLVGRFRSGMQVDNSPVSLDEWRVTTGDPKVAEAIAEMYGGHAEEWETKGEDSIQVLTSTGKVGIILDGLDSIKDKMVLWGSSGNKVHECDGMYFVGVDNEKAGERCGCPELLTERKEAAKEGYGPKPEISVFFRLADDPDLGKFLYRTASWDLVKSLHEIQDKLEDATSGSSDGPARATLALDMVEFTIKRGPRKGQKVQYTRPLIRILGPVEQ